MLSADVAMSQGESIERGGFRFRNYTAGGDEAASDMLNGAVRCGPRNLLRSRSSCRHSQNLRGALPVCVIKTEMLLDRDVTTHPVAVVHDVPRLRPPNARRPREVNDRPVAAVYQFLAH